MGNVGDDERDLSHQRERAVAVAAVLTVATVFAACASGGRLPGLRHDWWWPADLRAFFDVCGISWTGWDEHGIGHAAPATTSYHLALVLTTLAATLTPYVALQLFLLAIGAVCAASGYTLGRGTSLAGRAALAAIVAINPWTYTEVVAGHLYMLLAYGGTALAIAAARTGRWRSLNFCPALIVPQIQFAPAALAGFAWLALRRRNPAPFALTVVLLVPAVVGIVANLAALAHTPYLLVWQEEQSVPPFAALALHGYFAGYDQAIAPAFTAGGLLLAAVALAGCIAGRAPTGHRGVVTLGVVFAILFAAGTRGPFGTSYRWVVEHVVASGVYRELYDLIGYVAVGYAVLATFSMLRWPRFDIAVALAAAIFTGAWLAQPPFEQTTDMRAFSRASAQGAPLQRFALLPVEGTDAFAPRREGPDPDAFVRSGERAPLNSFLPAYPVDAALARLTRDCDARMAAALGVDTVVRRPWFSAPGDRCTAPPAVTAVTPLLSLGPPPAVGVLARNIGAGGTTAPDLDPENYATVVPPNELSELAEGWIDARLAFAVHPEFAQAFGGAATSAPGVTLALPGGRAYLAFVTGRIRSAGAASQVLAQARGAFRWFLAARDVTVRCEGLCAIVLSHRGTAPTLPLDAAPHVYEPLAISRAYRIFVAAVVPPGPPGTLRFNVAYDGGWVLLAPWHAAHVRIDGVVNGWSLPSRSQPARVVILERTAAVQCALAGVATAVLTAFLLAQFRRRKIVSAGL